MTPCYSALPSPLFDWAPASIPTTPRPSSPKVGARTPNDGRGDVTSSLSPSGTRAVDRLGGVGGLLRLSAGPVSWFPFLAKKIEARKIDTMLELQRGQEKVRSMADGRFLGGWR